MGRLALALQVTKDQMEPKQKNSWVGGEGGGGRRIGANQPNTPSNLLPRRLPCEERLPVPAGSTLNTQGLERGFCCNAARTCSPACPCQPGTATDLNSDTKPSSGTGEKSQHWQEAQLSTSQHTLPCLGELQVQLILPIPPSSGTAHPSLPAREHFSPRCSPTLLMGHCCSLMGWEFWEVAPKDSRVPGEAAAVPHPSRTTRTSVTGRSLKWLFWG